MAVPTIKLNSFLEWKYLASGGSATFYSAVWNREQLDDNNSCSSKGQQITVPTKVAVKSFNETDFHRRQTRKRIFEKLENLMSLNLRHKNVIRFFGVAEPDARYGNDSDIDFVLEFVEGKTLEQVIHNKENTYSLDEALSWMCQAADGISYLQSKGLKVRRLRPNNFVMAHSDDYSDIVKLTNFGFDYDSINIIRTNAITESTEPTWYLSPEAIRGEINDGSASWRCVYAFGIVLWEVFSRRKPYERHYSMFEILDAVASNGARPEPMKLNNVPYQVQELVERCWQEEHGNRPSMEEVGGELLKIRDKLTDEMKSKIV